MAMRNSRFTIHIKSSQGISVTRIDDFLSVQCIRRINQPGSLEFTLPGNHPAISSLEDRSIVELWMSNTSMGLPWTCETRGLYLAQNQRSSLGTVFTASCPGPLWLLSTRIIAYPPRVSGRSLFSGEAGWIARQLVRFNTTAEASTTNGRLRNGGVNGIVVEADSGGGLQFDWECACDNLLASLQKLGQAVGSDFDLIYLPPKNWYFRWYNGISGSDRTESAIFDLGSGNMLEPVYVFDSRQAKNVIVASGFDSAGSQIFNVQEGLWTVQEGDDYLEGRTAESYLHVPNCKTGFELAGRAKALLNKSKPQEQIKFRIRQVDMLQYGIDYFLGDKVTVRWAGNTLQKQVREIKILLQPDEKQDLEVEIS
ncbi:MAG: hypothetical protein EHM41_12125 [Chloroflexi bacterium]|nr:MAG: hypothetical protein EHM41_12125 [Chloroflexota bacterium]